MNLFGRLIVLFLKRLFSPQACDPFAVCSSQFLVNPLDLDINLHMNNGRYLSVMDLGRIDLMIRAGIFWKLLTKGYYPVVVSESIRFRRSLELFEKFTLQTQIESWNERDFFLTQNFFRGDELVAQGYLRARFRRRGRKGSTPTQEIFSMIGIQIGPPQLSAIANTQIEIEERLAQLQKN